MSAIFGIINKNGAPVAVHTMAKMQAALVHRDVDGKGIWHHDNVYLCQYKLNVPIVQDKEVAPFEKDGIVIIADSRIDNWEEINAALGIDPEVNDTFLTDSELIFAAYAKWGAQCVDHLEGEFAFAIWDKNAEKLFCATDHIGFRPLYYYDTPETFIFCSEMKGILAVKEAPNTFNEEVIIEYFFRKSDQTRTYNRDIFSLCGGYLLTVEQKQLQLRKYWSPQATGKYHFTKDGDWAECLRDLLIRSIEYRIDTQHPVGITLSGGLDSSSIACIVGNILAKRNKPLYAFSSVLAAGHKGIETDERKYIELIGKNLPNLHQTYVAAPDAGPFTDLERTFEIEETIPNAFFYMDHALLQAAQQKGVRLMFSGFGGDFFVSHKGSNVPYQLVQQHKYKEAINLLRLSHKFEASYLQILKTDYIAFTDFYKRYDAIKNKGSINWQSYTPLKESFTAAYTQGIDFSPVSDQQAWMLNYISSGQMGRMMGTFANRHAAYNMEASTPMFDKNIMEFMFDVPIEQYRVGGAKRSLIRRAMEGILPPEIQWRKDKQPYSPDYVNRIVREKGTIDTLLRSDSFNVTEKYIDKARITDNMHLLKPVAGMGTAKGIAAIRIAQAIITGYYLQWLQSNEYSF